MFVTFLQFNELCDDSDGSDNVGDEVVMVVVAVEVFIAVINVLRHYFTAWICCLSEMKYK